MGALPELWSAPPTLTANSEGPFPRGGWRLEPGEGQDGGAPTGKTFDSEPPRHPSAPILRSALRTGGAAWNTFLAADSEIGPSARAVAVNRTGVVSRSSQVSEHYFCVDEAARFEVPLRGRQGSVESCSIRRVEPIAGI